METVQSVANDDADVKEVKVKGKKEDVRTRNDNGDKKRKKQVIFVFKSVRCVIRIYKL